MMGAARGGLQFCWPWVLLLLAAAQDHPPCTYENCSQCLNNAFTPDQQWTKSMFGVDWTKWSVPFRIGRPNIPGKTSLAVFQQISGIFAQEILRKKVEYVPCETEAQCAYAIAGCSGWMDGVCDQTLTGWTLHPAIASGRKMFPDGVPDVMWFGESSSAYWNAEAFAGKHVPFAQLFVIDIGATGYTRIMGMYLPQDVITEGTASSGRELEWWESFRHAEARAVLDSPQDLINAGVQGDGGCYSNNPTVNASMLGHLGMGWTCSDSWFLNPACAAAGASWPTTCLVLLDDDWGEKKQDLYVSLAASRVPVAKVTVGYERWAELINNRTFNFTFLWSEPDATFESLKPVRLSLPAAQTPAARVFNKGLISYVYDDLRLLAAMRVISITSSQMAALTQRIGEEIARLGGYPGADKLGSFYQKIACDWVREHENLVRNTWGSTLNVCTAGMYVSAETSECERCPAGKQLTSATTNPSCQPCPPGTISKAGGSCTECPAGRFGNETEATRCDSCPAGQFTSATGQTVCEFCEAGTISTRNGRTECIECNLGTYSNPGGTQCEGCGYATFADTIGSPECTPCREGLTTRGVRSSSLSDCTCPEDSYWPLGAILDNATGPPFDCTPCPTSYLACREGSRAEDFANGTVSRMYLLAGYMSKVADPFQIYACIPPEACPGGAPGVCALNRDPTSVGCGSGLPGTYDTDEGFQKCTNSGADWAFLALFIVFGLAGICLFSYAISRDIHNQTSAGLLVMAVCGISFSSFQTMGVFNSLSIVWFEPLRSIFRVVSLISLDVKYLRVTCLFTSVGPTFSYTLRQLIAPGGAAVMFLTLFAKKFFVPVDLMPEFINAVGSVFTLFFTSIVISAATPFICYAHPVGGKSSMVNEPSVLCFEDPDHAAMVVVGLISFCFVAIPFLALSAYGTLKHHTFLSSHLKSHARQLRAFRFLFIRFRADVYYFSLIMSMRSVFVCLVPTMPGTRDDPAMQFSSLAAVLGLFIVVQLSLWPWRSTLANVADGVLMSCNLQLLVCAAIHTTFTETDSIGLFGSVVFSLFCVLIICGCLLALRLYFVPNPWYHYFICHHKGGAAAQARYLKVLLQERASCNVFIDSDDLRELDKLFDTVKTKVGMLVVYLTRETLMRPWCAGEVYTAFRSGVKVQVLETPSFVPPTEDELEDMDNYLDLRSCNLTQYGILLPDVANAFRQLMDKSTPKILVPRGGTTRWKTICDGLTKKGMSTKSVHKETLHANSFVVSSEPHHEEASAAAGIISSKIKMKIVQLSDTTHMCVTCDHPNADLEDIARVISQAKSVVVLLSSGTLYNLQQVMVIVALMSQGEADVIPVRIHGFEFPDDDYFNRDLDALWPGDSTEAALHLRSFFKRIAIHLEIAGSDQILQKQIDDIFNRVSGGKRKSSGTATLAPEVRALLEAQHELTVHQVKPTSLVNLKEDVIREGDELLQNADQDDSEAVGLPSTVVVQGRTATDLC